MQPQGIDLSGLKDIHLPPIPSLWPLPVTFWIVLASVLSGVFLIHWIWFQKHKITARKYANREVESITRRFNGNSYKISSELSLLMSRIALTKYPRTDISGLTGKTWRQFLEKTTKKPVFKGEAGDIIENVMFIPPDRFENKNVDALIAAAKEWIVENT